MPTKKPVLIGQRFGRLVVLGEVLIDNHWRWE